MVWFLLLLGFFLAFSFLVGWVHLQRTNQDISKKDEPDTERIYKKAKVDQLKYMYHYNGS